MLTTFIYTLNDPATGEVRYVGKSDNPYNRLRKHISLKTKDYRGCWIKSLKLQGLEPVLEVLEEIPTPGWEEVEKEYIRVFRAINFPLVNTALGGEGVMTGRKASPETRARLRVSHLGHKRSEESKLKSGKFHLGRKRSLETKLKMGSACLGTRVGMLGKIHSPETKSKMREAWVVRREKKGGLYFPA